MGRRPRLTQEQRDNILRDYLKGDRLYDIADRYGVHHTYPPLLARRHELKMRSKRTNKRFPK